MPNIKDLQTLKINYLTQELYDQKVSLGEINEDELYFTPHESLSFTLNMYQIESNDSSDYPFIFTTGTMQSGANSEGYFDSNIWYTAKSHAISGVQRLWAHDETDLLYINGHTGINEENISYTPNYGNKKTIDLNPNSLTSFSQNYTIEVPDKSGTIALLSDIPSPPTAAALGAITNITTNATAPLTLSKTVSGTTVTIAGSVSKSDSVSQNDSSTLATSKAVKIAYDLAQTANTTANAAMPKTGGTFSGQVIGAASTSAQLTTANLKNIILSTSLPSNASSYPIGTVWIQYEN